MTFVIGKWEKRRGRCGNLKGTQKKHVRAVDPAQQQEIYPQKKK